MVQIRYFCRRETKITPWLFSLDGYLVSPAIIIAIFVGESVP
jgi:hypothetical protein